MNILTHILCSLFKKAQQELRNHDFDLNNSKVEKVTQNRTIEIFECKKCGQKISLERWQMKNLPFGLKHGCRGFKFH